MLHVASVSTPCSMLLCAVAQSLKPVKLLAPCKRTYHCWPATPNILGRCCARLHVALLKQLRRKCTQTPKVKILGKLHLRQLLIGDDFFCLMIFICLIIFALLFLSFLNEVLRKLK